MTEALSARELFDAVAREEASLVVLGPRLPDVPIEEAIRRIREGPAGQRASILVLIPASDPVGTEGVVLGAGANAALRRPLERFVLESWVAKLLDVPRRVLARIPVHVQVVGSRKSAPGEHFYGLSRNLSVHGMLLASPVRIEAEDLDLEIDLPEPEGRVRVLGRIAREAPEVGWPYMGYGIEFLFLPEAGAARDRPHGEARDAARAGEEPLGSRGHPLDAAARRVDLRDHRARADGQRLPGRGPPRVPRGLAPRAGEPLLRRAGESARGALDTAREFVRRHG